MAQLVEHVIGNDEVISSTLIASSRIRIAIAVRILFLYFHRTFIPPDIGCGTHWRGRDHSTPHVLLDCGGGGSNRRRNTKRAPQRLSVEVLFWWSVGDSEPKCAANVDIMFFVIPPHIHSAGYRLRYALEWRDHSAPHVLPGYGGGGSNRGRSTKRAPQRLCVEVLFWWSVGDSNP